LHALAIRNHPERGSLRWLQGLGAIRAPSEMPPIVITKTITPVLRSKWREWLSDNHATEREIWLLYHGKAAERQAHELTYLDAVEEALCFGWIDSTRKVHDGGLTAMRVTPRRRTGSNWTELNKFRCRDLIAQGLMTPAGLAVLPDLSDGPLVLAKDIEAQLKADAAVWRTFVAFPERYKRVRVANIEECRKKDKVAFRRRLQLFIKKTGEGKMYGQWDDSKLPRSVVERQATTDPPSWPADALDEG
jgi:uncharacterized protein YdeI (YjbR/CyaY-like superfamily)